MKTRIGPIGCLVLLVASTGSLAAPPQPEPPLPERNAKIVEFARENLGKSVGDGSCTTLAIAALKAAGARYYPQMERGGDYVWGERVDSFQEALPGDILQFRNAVFQGKKTLPRRRWVSWYHEYPHHTAIVSRVSEGGKVVAVLHQNVAAKGKDEKESKNVQETTLPIDSLQKGGWVRIYRPVDPPAPFRPASPLPPPDAGLSVPDDSSGAERHPSKNRGETGTIEEEICPQMTQMLADFLR